jgi:hypothetical protein
VSADTEALLATVREAHAKAMAALGAADVHPYSGPAIRDWEQQLDAALDSLAAELEKRGDNERHLTNLLSWREREGTEARAEVERVKAERDEWRATAETESRWQAELQARLDRALAALREITSVSTADPLVRDVQAIARAAIAEIEGEGR